MIEQLSVFVENELGSLAQVTQCIEDGDINIKAFAVYDTSNFGILRLIVDNAQKAKEILKENGFLVRLNEVIGIEIEDEKGALNGILQMLKGEGLSINYMYSMVLRDQEKPLMVLDLEDNEKGREILESKGVKSV